MVELFTLFKLNISLHYVLITLRKKQCSFPITKTFWHYGSLVHNKDAISYHWEKDVVFFLFSWSWGLNSGPTR
jgi:hypothetical protein